MFRRFMCILALFMTVTAFAQTPTTPPATPSADPPALTPVPEKTPEAVEILKKADEATKKLKGARYKATVTPTGFRAARGVRTEGEVLIAGELVGMAPKTYRATGKFTTPDSKQPAEVTIGSDGENYYQIDHHTKTVYVDIDPAVLGTDGQMVFPLMMVEFIHDSPFSDELNGTKVQLAGTETIGTEDCHQIHIVYGGDRGQEAMWYFSKKDFLPRGVDRISRNQAKETGATEMRISELQPDPTQGDAEFKLTIPEGYKKVEDFAPKRGGGPGR